MKGRIVNLSIAIMLILVCVVSFVIDNAGKTVGAGMGKNARVNSVEDLTAVLEFVAKRGSISSFALLSNVDNENGEEEQEPEADKLKHSSATIHISTRLKSESTVDQSLLGNRGGQTYSLTNMERELTLYMTEDATYYESEGIYFSKSNYRSKNEDGDWINKENNSMFRFKMEIFVTSEKTYMKFYEFNLIDNSESRVIKPEYTKKWISLPYEIFEGIIDVDSWNREVMASLGEMLDFLMEEGAITKDDSSVSFNERELKEIFEEAEGSVPYSPEDYKIDFNIDLSNSTSPVITLNEVLDYQKSYNQDTHGVSGTQTTKAKCEQVVTIKNIDNTVAKVKESQISVEIKDGDDSEKMFKVEEADDDDN